MYQQVKWRDYRRWEKNPKLLYSDEEGSLNCNDVMKYLETEKMKIHKTRAHPFFLLSDLSEFKKICCSKGQSDQKKGKENIQWIDYNVEILLAYNTKNIRSATGLVPAEAEET